MQESYLEVTFRHGNILAAYFHLPCAKGQRSARCERVEPGFVIDFDVDNHPIGIELTAPQRVTVDDFNQLLVRLGQSPVEPRDLAPLQAA